MISRIALSRTLGTRLTTSVNRSRFATPRCFFGTVADSPSATDAWKKSCYLEIDFTISEDDDVIEAIQRLAAYDIGCLVTLDEAGEYYFGGGF